MLYKFWLRYSSVPTLPSSDIEIANLFLKRPLVYVLLTVQLLNVQYVTLENDIKLASHFGLGIALYQPFLPLILK